MADEHDKWLNRETAERLLRGESLEVVDATAREQAERLFRALGALSAQVTAATGELPGEQAALAAFRKAREAAEAERTAAALDGDLPGRHSGAPERPADAGLVRIGAPARPARTGIPGRRSRRPRWAHPARLALAAGLSAGMLGGVAMAVGSGVLPTPFDSGHPDPAASVSAGQTSGAPLTSVAPSTTQGPGPGVPSGSAGGATGASGRATGPSGGPGPSGSPGAGAPSGAPGDRWQDLATACRDLRNGKAPDSGRMRALEDLAGGSGEVNRYCKVILTTVESTAGGTQGGTGGNGVQGGDQGKGQGQGNGEGQGNGKGGDDEGQGGDGSHPGDGHHGDGGDHGNGHGKGGHRSAASAPVPSAFAPARPAPTDGTAPAPVPSPTYSAH